MYEETKSNETFINFCRSSYCNECTLTKEYDLDNTCEDIFSLLKQLEDKEVALLSAQAILSELKKNGVNEITIDKDVILNYKTHNKICFKDLGCDYKIVW